MENGKSQLRLMSEKREFIPLEIAVLTVSDSRTQKTDLSGKCLVECLTQNGHHLYEHDIVVDDIYAIRHVVSKWIATPKVQVILTTGGTGVSGRDGTPEAISVLLDKEIVGFGEQFRAISYQQIKTSTIQSRAMAGVANRTYIFVLPGSKGACKTAWDELINYQLNYQTRPCNLVELIPRLSE